MRETKEEELLCTALQERDRGSNLDAFFLDFLLIRALFLKFLQSF